MIIIDKNKDYYDYLVGVYGRDTDIVFDRRDSIRLNNGIKDFENPYWCMKKLYNDEPKQVNSTFNRWRYLCQGSKSPLIDFKEKIGHIFFIIIEIANTHYYFKIERYLDDREIVHIDPTLLEVRKDIKRVGKGMINVIRCSYTIFNGELKPERVEYENAILKDTWVTKFIPPEEVYNTIYDYLISTREKPIEDSRSDVQKAESHGFNKESFRNPTRLKDLK